MSIKLCLICLTPCHKQTNQDIWVDLVGDVLYDGQLCTNRHPADLCSQVSEVQSCCGTHRKMLENIFILQRLPL